MDPRARGIARAKPADFAIVAILVVGSIISQLTTPSMFNVSREDPRFLYEHVDRTTNLILFAVFTVVAFPSVIIAVHRLATIAYMTLGKALISYSMSVLTALFFTSLLQIYVGMPSPDTVSVCGDVTLASCEDQTSKFLAMRQFKSFPSDLAAVTACAAVFCLKFVHAMWTNDSTWAVIVKLIPLALLSWSMATLIATSMNSPADVAMGTLIGVVIGLVFTGVILESRTV